MKRFLFPLMAILAAGAPSIVLAAPSGGSSATDGIMSSIVQITVQSNPADPFNPWQKLGGSTFSGSGVVVEGGRILTAAHVVSQPVTIEVKRQGQTRKYDAEPVFVGQECDLAILEVSDPAFFEGSVPVPLGRTPGIEDQVTVYGFPEGGDTVSVTSGIVSRVEVARYINSWRNLLLVQIDAAINQGNSGGPVISGGRLAGIAMQMLEGAENIGYMVPAAVIEHFLKDVEDGSFDGFPTLGVVVQSLENEALRAEYGLDGDETGVLVTVVDHGSSASGVLKRGDVILGMDGYGIAEDGTVKIEGLGRVHHSYLVHSRQVGEVLELSILREGSHRREKVALKNESRLVPGNFYDEGADYYVFGGLVFQPMTLDYLSWSYSEEGYTSDLDYWGYFHNTRTKEREQVILLSKVLPAPVNRGYHSYVDYIVSTVQGRVPRNIADLVAIIEGTQEKRLRIEMETGEIVVLDMARARRDGGKILEKHGVQADRSPGLRK